MERRAETQFWMLTLARCWAVLSPRESGPPTRGPLFRIGVWVGSPEVLSVGRGRLRWRDRTWELDAAGFDLLVDLEGRPVFLRSDLRRVMYLDPENEELVSVWLEHDVSVANVINTAVERHAP